MVYTPLSKMVYLRYSKYKYLTTTLAITRLFIRLLAFSQLPYGFIIRAFTQVVQ